MKRSLLGLLAFLLLQLSACTAQAEKSNVYIDSIEGNDRNSGTTPGEALKSLSSLKKFKLSAGDTVYLKSGSVWFEELVISSGGKKGNPVVITSYGSGSKPVLDGQKIRKNCIYLYQKEYVTVSNLNMINSNGSGNIRIAYGKGIIVENCDFLVIGHAGIFIETSSDCRLSGNFITTPPGITYAQTDGIYSQRNDKILIEGNRIHLRNDSPVEHIDGIQSFQDKDIIISSNYIFQDNSKPNGQGIYATTAKGRHIYINNVVNCPNILASGIGFRNLQEGNGSVEVYNNTVKSRGSNNLYLTDVTDVKVKNNIFISTAEAYVIHITSPVEDPINNFNNNIYFREGKGNVVNYPPGGGGKTFDQWQMEGFDLRGLLTDPKLDDSLHVSPDSPALKAGSAIEIKNFNHPVSVRTTGSDFDIGASLR